MADGDVLQTTYMELTPQVLHLAFFRARPLSKVPEQALAFVDFLEALSPVWKSNFTALNRRVVLHAIDATPADWLISTQVVPSGRCLRGAAGRVRLLAPVIHRGRARDP